MHGFVFDSVVSDRLDLVVVLRSADLETVLPGTALAAGRLLWSDVSLSTSVPVLLDVFDADRRSQSRLGGKAVQVHSGARSGVSRTYFICCSCLTVLTTEECFSVSMVPFEEGLG